MRSRRDDIDWAAAVRRALELGVCGMGAADDERAGRRLERFEAAPTGSFVWTRDGGGHTYVGRLTGSLRTDPRGAPVGLVHVRDCEWSATPVEPLLIPSGVAQTFARGGRNFQQIHTAGVEAETTALWQRLND
ncbi:MAG: hypothetical protein QOJ72_2907 [Nocardioidaceae bacterium]|jgi:hypothetical protein|nr:hypothetical protein [Nocardioidaceae bacterium]